ncbi:hypothetical protein L6452_28775 [Arctium lappa]|uniref:Uncharacterized protein n=1 Tax=Arctium lappa TaxID=4217 RepID=A0ACB8ZZV4_ARCLA|nr:hypothetical protein L6452_28775 [Arctium lappa]
MSTLGTYLNFQIIFGFFKDIFSSGLMYSLQLQDQCICFNYKKGESLQRKGRQKRYSLWFGFPIFAFLPNIRPINIFNLPAKKVSNHEFSLFQSRND